jgi:hypothetical protein
LIAIIPLKEDFSMQCPECGRRIPDNSDSCLYWRAWIKGEASSEARTEPPTMSVSSGKMGENIIGIQLTKEEINFKKLEGPPLSIRARVEEILKKGEGQSEEIRTSFRNISESMERAGRRRKRRVSSKPSNSF